MSVIKTKSARHHWWPECVSTYWADDAGGVNWLLPDSSERRARPDAFGVIGNGHYIKLSRAAGETTVWDQNFEDEFQEADDQFPAVIAWVKGLDYEARPGVGRRDRFLPQPATDEQFRRMAASLTSLAIRSPMTREAAVSIAERLRGPLPERECNTLIAANLRDLHRRAMQAVANDTEYGLAAGIWTRDLSRAHRVASLIEAGQIYVNEYFAGGVETPLRGFKQSGYGRGKGHEALHYFTHVKGVTMRL